MTKTRAKFKCVAVEKREGWNAEMPILHAAKFQAVMGGSEENKAFFVASPNGSIELSTVREDHFQVGKYYYVDFTAAD